MLKKRYPFSLIEVIIATSLFSILIFSTTSLFFRYHKINARLDQLRPKVFERTLFFEKMSDITASLDTATLSMESPHYEEFLSFDYDGGFKDDTEFSGRISCQLYRTYDKELIFKLKGSSGKEKKFVILRDIKSFKPEVSGNLLHLNITNLDESTIPYTFLLQAGKRRAG